MRDNSLICELIYTNKNWREILESKKIIIKTEGYYSIFNYDVGCDFSDPYVCEARGIIIDTEMCHVVCRGFDKFFNVQESYASEIDWDSAVVQEKIDGSIIKFWWSKRLNQWVVSTNGTIFAKDAPCNNTYSFYDIVLKAENYKTIMETLKFDYEARCYTWIFELVSQYNQIVIKYDNTVLYHIGCRNNTTGWEYLIRTKFYPVPKIYPLKTLDDCLHAVNELNKSITVTNEGFVVADKYFNRIKIKSPEYFEVHRLIGNHIYNKEKVIDFVLSKQKFEVDEFNNDIFRLYKKYYDFNIDLFRYGLSEFLDYCLNLDEEYNHNRKAIALQIKDHIFSGYGFSMLFKGKTKEDIINGLNTKDYSKYIVDFTKILKGEDV